MSKTKSTKPIDSNGDDDPLLTSTQVAKLFYVATSTAWRWAAEGKIPSVKTPGGPRKVRLSDVQAVLGEVGRERY